MILSRYLNREVLTSTTAILGVLFAIFMSQRIVKYLAQAAAGDISGSMVWQMVGLYSPILIGFLLPLAFFLGCLLAFSRLYVDSEMAVLRSVGVSERFLIKMLAPVALFIAVVGGAVTLWLSPQANELTYQIRDEHASKLELSMLTPGHFQMFQQGQGVVYAESSERPTKLGNFFLAEMPSETNPNTRIISAQSAERFYDESIDKNFLQLNDGHVYELDDNQQVSKVTRFERYFARLDAERSIVSRRKISATSSPELLATGDGASWAELHWRLAVPISVPLFMFLAIPLSRVRPREGKFAKMLPALMVYIGYIVLIVVFRRALESEQIPGWLGFIPIYIVMGILAARLLYLHGRSNSPKAKKQTADEKGAK
ncbi:LPS export ABC transporter permease LptF [Kangiella sp.]|uniref:LPS export ABC transporter permease LptF n=1 Tax=Kangiella sp. TaxID=1920245 RepID=UPI003A8FA9A4